MWHALTELLLGLHAQGLSHEAVIEIMVALLGIMLTVFGVVVAVIGWFGYSAIRDEAVRRAKKEARKVAEEAAENLFRMFASEEEAAAYSESQKEVSAEQSGRNSLPAPVKDREDGSSGTTAVKANRKRAATNDSTLKRRNKV